MVRFPKSLGVSEGGFGIRTRTGGSTDVYVRTAVIVDWKGQRSFLIPGRVVLRALPGPRAPAHQRSHRGDHAFSLHRPNSPAALPAPRRWDKRRPRCSTILPHGRGPTEPSLTPPCFRKEWPATEALRAALARRLLAVSLEVVGCGARFVACKAKATEENGVQAGARSTINSNAGSSHGSALVAEGFP